MCYFPPPTPSSETVVNMKLMQPADVLFILYIAPRIRVKGFSRNYQIQLTTFSVFSNYRKNTFGVFFNYA
jgi:hypothetical protein